MERINIGVIGCGYWGPNLIRNFQALTDCQVQKISDINPERLSYIQKLYPEIDTTDQVDNIINDTAIDAVVIATPVHLHFELAQKSLQAGKHTLVEKPMASSVAECQKLVELAQQQKLVLMVGHTFIYAAAVRKIREIVASGDIGEIRYISARRLNLGVFQYDLNVVWDQASHDLSIILYLTQQMPLSVSCQGKAHITEGIEDVANLSLDFADGNFATIQNSWLHPSKVREMTIVGSRKMIIYDDTEPLAKVKIHDKRVETPPHYDTFADFKFSYNYGDSYAPYLKHVEPLKAQGQHFLDCIRHGTQPDSSGGEGLQVVQILEAATESLQNNGAKIQIEGLPKYTY